MTSNYSDIVSKTIKKFGSKYNLNQAERDDMESIIVVHLAELCAQDPTQETLLAQPAYLTTVSRNSALDYIRVLLRNRNRTTILSDYHELATEEIDTDSIIWLQQALSQLTPAQFKIIKIYYGLDGLPPVQWVRSIVKLTGYTSGKVTQLLDSAMQTLKKAAE
jgi:RNA polymerase sigma factor (sigma-70 family)